MLIDRSLLAGAFGLVLLVAACGGSSAPAASRAPNEPTAPAGNTPGGAPELEAMLPSEVGGVQLQKRSFGGTGFTFDAGAPFDSSALDPLLEANGKTIEDVRLAIAWPVGAKLGALGTSVMALQVKGVDIATLMGSTGASASLMPTTVIGGKQVFQAGDVLTYFKDDMAFTVMVANPDDAAAVLAALP